MFGLLGELCLVARDALWALIQLFINGRGVRMSNRVEIAASRDIVWDVATMLNGRLDGTPPIEYSGEVIDERERLIRQSARLGRAEWQTTSRVIDECEATSRIFEVVDSTPVTVVDDAAMADSGVAVADSPQLNFGEVELGYHRYGFEIEDAGGDHVVLHMFHEVERPTLSQMIALPMTMRIIQRRIKDRCQARAGTTDLITNPLVREMDEAGDHYGVEYDNLLVCIAAAGLTIGCFGTLYGWAFALILTLAMALNDGAYRMARRMLGLGDSIVFSVPFARAVAVEADDDGTAIQRAAAGLYAALFASLPTAVLFGFFLLTGEGAFGVAATILSLFNLAYLLPILPLDGAKVLCAISRILPERISVAAAWSAAVVAGMLALVADSGLMALGVGLVIIQLALWANPMDLDPLEESEAVEPDPNDVTGDEALLCFAGYLALVGLYSAILLATYTDPSVAALYEPASLLSDAMVGEAPVGDDL